jgi:hypothetical protein
MVADGGGKWRKVAKNVELALVSGGGAAGSQRYVLFDVTLFSLGGM